VGPQGPPARRCVSLSTGTPRRAGPSYGLPAQANRGVPIQRRYGVTPIGWTASGWNFDQLAGMTLLELNGTLVTKS
jgi:hypothetical protein